ncbi:hypothetical protein GcC1_005034 [Golovinomyces cichoracearum]|uniref:Uncharacterized protein n=1 Tax=Golovinomyces cichoracearum TaxID=62708 RepID=A0A420J8V1_9PEZI|nr:hypothetical protein GcC1_005034 [Golovinomyces cichoracearum]
MTVFYTSRSWKNGKYKTLNLLPLLVGTIKIVFAESLMSSVLRRVEVLRNALISKAKREYIGKVLAQENMK